MIALGNGLDPLADGHDHTGAFVAEHGGKRVRGPAGDDVPVTVADAGRGNAHLDLAEPRAANSTSSTVMGWSTPLRMAARMQRF